MGINSFYNIDELKTLGFNSLGRDVLISRYARIYTPNKINIGNNVRIDDFCILSGEIDIGNYVHISAYTALYGKYGIEISDFCGCSPRCTVFSATDDFSGKHLISPMVPTQYTNIISGKVKLERFVQIGTNSIVMPNVTIKEGSCTGAFSFVKNDLPEWGIYVGIPAKRIKSRLNNLKKLSEEI